MYLGSSTLNNLVFLPQLVRKDCSQHFCHWKLCLYFRTVFTGGLLCLWRAVSIQFSTLFLCLCNPGSFSDLS